MLNAIAAAGDDTGTLYNALRDTDFALISM
jgi:hypothetical protein